MPSLASLQQTTTQMRMMMIYLFGIVYTGRREQEVGKESCYLQVGLPDRGHWSLHNQDQAWCLSLPGASFSLSFHDFFKDSRDITFGDVAFDSSFEGFKRDITSTFCILNESLGSTNNLVPTRVHPRNDMLLLNFPSATMNGPHRSPAVSHVTDANRWWMP
jgi:hypothetical protein